jgi:DNA-binding NarL/FixJ family response regulator
MRVVVAEDSTLLREGLERLLADAGLEVVGSCPDADDLLEKVATHEPDVAVVDIRMPPTHTDEGLQAAMRIRERHPGTGVLVLSQYVELGLAMQLLSESPEGAGYLLKDRVADVAEFAGAVRRVGDGGSAIDSTIVSQLLGRVRGEGGLSELTPREREVLALMAEGWSNHAIAGKLVITVRSTEKHVSSIFSKLGLGNAPADNRRVLAVLAFLGSR